MSGKSKLVEELRRAYLERLVEFVKAEKLPCDLALEILDEIAVVEAGK